MHRFSPSGARAAITPAHEALDVAQTFLYQDGQLVDAVDGAALGWLDEDRVLVARYRRDMTGAPYWHLLGTTVHAADGTSVATPMLPDLRPFDPSRPVAVPVGGGHLHVPKHNAVYDQHTGDIVWQGPAVTVGGAVAGDHVVYAHRQRVIVERFRP